MEKGIRTIDEFEYKGYWYLSKNPKKKVPGILKHTKEGIFLDVFDYSQEKSIEINKNDIILGDTTEKITLIDGFIQKEKREGYLKFVRFFFHKLIIGKHFNSVNDIKFSSVSVNFTHFEKWLSSLKQDTQFNFNQINITYSKQKTKTIDVPYIQSKIEIDTQFSLREEKYKETFIKHYGYILINPYKVKRLDWYIQKVKEIQDFLTLLTDYPIYPMRINGYTNNSNNKESKVSIFILPIYKIENKEINPKELFVRFPHIENKIDKMLLNWFKICNEPSVHLYLKNIYRTDYNYLYERVIDLSNSLESFHRSFYNIKDIYLRERAKELLNQIDNRILKIILNGKDEEFLAKNIVKKRNLYTHFSEQVKKTKDRNVLLLLNFQIKVLMIYHLLKIIGIDDDDFYKIFQSSLLNERLNKIIDMFNNNEIER